MTIPEVTPAGKRYIANGSTLNFTYDFAITDTSELLFLMDGELQIYGTHYSLTGVGSTNGGQVQCFFFPPDGATITLLRNQSISQLIPFAINSSYPPPAVERSLGILTRVDQMLAERIGRSLKLAPESAYSDLSVSDPVADQFLRFKSDLSGIESAAAIAGSITASLSAGRIPFASSGTALTNSSSLLWTEASKRLGISNGEALLAGNLFTQNFLFSGPASIDNKSPFQITGTTLGTHPNQVWHTLGIVSTPKGSGTNGPAHMDVGLGLSILKQDWATSAVDGQTTAAFVFVRQGSAGDASGFDINVAGYGNNFYCTLEGVTYAYNAASVIQQAVDVQIGAVDIGGLNLGYFAAKLNGAGGEAFRASEVGAASWDNFINCIRADSVSVFKVDRAGALTIGDPIKSIGSGAAATLALIGAPGPTLFTAQVGWLKFLDINGAARFIPVWA